MPATPDARAPDALVGHNGYTGDVLFARFLPTGAPDSGFGKGGFFGPYLDKSWQAARLFPHSRFEQ